MKIWLKGLALTLAVLLLLSGCATGNQPADGSNPHTATTASVRKTDSSSANGSTTSATQATDPSGNKTAVGKPTGNQNTTSTRVTSTTPRTQVIIDYPLPPPSSGTVKVAGMAGCYFDLDQSSNVWDKRIAEELEIFEKRTNITFKFSKYDAASLTEQCIKADAAGQKFADIIVTNVWQQKSLMAARALTDLNSVKNLDLKKEYWDQSARKSMELYGKNFIGFTTLDGTAANANLLYFNKTLAKKAFDKLGDPVATPEAAAEKLYAMVDNGQWTFEQMQILSQQAQVDLTLDGKMDDRTAKDQYGFSGVDMRNNVGYTLFRAKGGYFTKKSADGTVIYALGDAINMTALRYMQTWMLKDTSIFNPDKFGTNPELGADAFFEGRVLFLGWSASRAPAFSSMRDDWGILPYPKASADTASVTTVDWDMQGFSIPRKVKGDDLNLTAIALDGLAKYLAPLAEEKERYLQQRVLRDTDSLRMMQLAASTATIDFVQFGDLGAGGMSTIQYLFDSANNDPKLRADTVRESSIAALTNFLKKVK